MTLPHWWSRAQRVARTFQSSTKGERTARHSVYVILLHDPAREGRWGLYVGQTARDPDWRFDQHKAGYRSSAAVRRFGVRLVPDLFQHLNPVSEWESRELEEAMADAFRSIGIWVEGGH
ncbi:hypothetical protein [Sphingomonas sp.]|jgi:predicted GIY-YIG superfamily endonuclease|uniref:hypothetical protein n=1 Tax=Sphingomonas sp. TaxID=28214 RepID=UPI002DF66E68|nr:hypothetical protein [Sphingomonas sp.]